MTPQPGASEALPVGAVVGWARLADWPRGAPAARGAALRFASLRFPSLPGAGGPGRAEREPGRGGAPGFLGGSRQGGNARQVGAVGGIARAAAGRGERRPAAG